MLKMNGGRVDNHQTMLSSTYQTIANFSEKSEIDNLRLTCREASRVCLQDKLWILTNSPQGDSEYMQNVRSVRTNLTDFYLPTLEELDAPHVTGDCLDRHLQLLVVNLAVPQIYVEPL